jgi:hypothetical protein
MKGDLRQKEGAAEERGGKREREREKCKKIEEEK